MNAKKDGGLAFPGKRMELTTNALGPGPNYIEATYPGMTLRDYFAAKAMQGLISSRFLEAASSSGHPSSETAKLVAAFGYAQADAMLAERAK